MTQDIPKKAKVVSIAIFVIFTLLFFFDISRASAADTSYSHCGTSANDSSIGTTGFSSSTCASDDSLFEAWVDNNQITYYLKTTNYGFSIPSNATINGITIKIEIKSNGSGQAKINDLKLYKAGTIVGSSRGTGGYTFGTSDSYVLTFGSTSDLWGTTWNASDINNSGFGLGVSAIGGEEATRLAGIDDVQISVNYTESPVYGCTNAAATNYDPAANTDDGSCIYPIGPIFESTVTNGTTSYSLTDDGWKILNEIYAFAVFALALLTLFGSFVFYVLWINRD